MSDLDAWILDCSQIGDGCTLNPADMLGVMIGAMKELSMERAYGQSLR